MSDFEDNEEERDESTDSWLEDLIALFEKNNSNIEQDLEETLANSRYGVIGGAAIHPEAVPPTHDYEVTLKFSTRDSRSKVDEFIEEVMKLMPNGTSSHITTAGEAIAVDDLDWGHVGQSIRLVVEGRTVEGKLEALYDTGVGSGISRTLIIDGKAWSVSFGVAELNV